MNILTEAIIHAFQRTGSALVYFKGILKVPCFLLSVVSIPAQIFIELMLSI